MNNRLSIVSGIVALVCAIALIGVLLLPIWKIELAAPQYPEGLVLKIYANKLAGDIAVVNGLNHYIGMHSLHEKDFVEFAVLPWIIGAFVFFGLLSVLVNRRWFFITWVACYLLFAIIAVVDFYRWEYNYGHNLDPAAPIQVPGMAYQPPLIGFKQLLNFGAYSIPDFGGWIFTSVGLLLTVVAIRELRNNKRKVISLKASLTAAAITSVFFFSSCQTGPQSIHFGQDACDYCKMTILDQRFGGEIVTKKGKIFKFDDFHCLASFLKSTYPSITDIAGIYFLDYATANRFIKADESYLLQSDNLNSPMGGNTAAFADEESMNRFKQQLQGTTKRWHEAKQ
jgi:copper chaperone NosL